MIASWFCVATLVAVAPSDSPKPTEEPPKVAPAPAPDSTMATPTAAPGRSNAPPPAVTDPGVQPVLAGFGNEFFFLKSADDNFILMPNGRLQLDAYTGQPGSRAPPSSLLIKRSRIEANGSLFHHWDFLVGAEYTAPGVVATDAWLNADFTRYANVQVGQYDGLFTMDGHTSDKWSDMQDRTTLVRSLAYYAAKQIGASVWGQPEKKWAYWAVGLFNGEGQNVAHRSNSYEVQGRAWLAPFGLANVESLSKVWIGGSFEAGQRAATAANQIDRPTMRDQGGEAFFVPSNGAFHAGDHGAIRRYAGELNAPIGQFVLKGEVLHVDDMMREVDPKTAALGPNAELTGGGFYVRLSYFVWGDPLINGLAGQQNPPRLYGTLKPGKTDTALQLVAQYEHTALTYTPSGPAAPADKLSGDFGIDVIGVGVNYWATKHLRLTANALYDTFSGGAIRPSVLSDNTWEVTGRAQVVF